MEELSHCSQCETAFRQEPGDAGLCGSCREAQHPSIEGMRGKKWSPLQLGLFSIVCDVMLIPSIMAITRGLGELREVGKREAAGVWRPEHERVRTGAVFGLLAGAARPAVLALIFVAAFASPRAQPRAPFGFADELEDIHEALEHGDEEDQEIAAVHLMEVSDDLTRADALRLLGMARETGRPDTRSVYLRTAIMAPDAVTFADVRDLYEPADASGRTAILFAATRDGTRESVEGLVELLETYPGEQFLDAESLVALRQHADLYLARLVALPDESSGHALGIETAQLLCGRRAPHSLFTPLQNALLFEWAAARGGLGQSDPAGYGEESRRAEAAIRALGCVDTAAVGPVIEEASRLADPHVAVAAVEGMLGRGDRIDPATIHRLAEAPESRWRIFRALEGTSSLRLVPRALRTSRALADGFVAQWGGPWTHVGVERRRFAGVEMDVHVYESGDMRIAAGPFADDAADDVVEVSAEEENVWSPSDLADALHASWAEGIAE